MKQLFTIIVSVICICCGVTSSSRTKIIKGEFEIVQRELHLETSLTGIVRDNYSGAVLPYANVYVTHDTLLSVMANENGRFKLDLIPGKYDLSVTSAGNTTLVIKRLVLKKGERINLALKLGTFIQE